MRVFALLLICQLAGCLNIAESLQPAQLPSRGYRLLELRVDESFDALGSWRSYEGAGLSMGVADGAYRIDLSARQYVWTQAAAEYADAVIDAEVQQLSDAGYSALGIACRLDPANSGRGYFFLISGDGHYSIRWSNGRSLESIVPATASPLIVRGAARNRLRAVCIGDYLALWINGRFAAEARDGRAVSGAVGLSGVLNAERRLTAVFERLVIWDAAFDD